MAPRPEELDIVFILESAGQLRRIEVPVLI